MASVTGTKSIADCAKPDPPNVTKYSSSAQMVSHSLFVDIRSILRFPNTEVTECVLVNSYDMVLNDGPSGSPRGFSVFADVGPRTN